jgi:hypothetical protein
MRLAPLLPLAFALAFALALAIPSASAQIPTPSAPGDVVAKLCGVASAAPVHVPVCPIANPPPPADPNAPHEHPGAPDVPGSPQDTQALAQDAAGQAQGAAQDPQSAPDRAAALVATIVQFVKDLLQLPGIAGAHVHASAVDAGHAIGALGAKAGAAGARVSNAAGALVSKISALFHGGDASSAAPRVRAPLARSPDPIDVKHLIPGQVREVLKNAQ